MREGEQAMVDRDRRDAIVKAWKSAGSQWSRLSNLTSGVPWGFGLALEALGLLDHSGQYRPASEHTAVGVDGESLVIVTWSQTDESHDAELRFVPLSRVGVVLEYHHPRRSLEYAWRGQVRFTVDEEIHQVDLEKDDDLRWASEVYRAATST